MEFPIIAVVHPVYHSLEGNGGHGNFLESGKRRLSCDRVLRRSKGYVIAITTEMSQIRTEWAALRRARVAEKSYQFQLLQLLNLLISSARRLAID